MDINKVDENTLYERAGPAHNAIRIDAHTRVDCRKNNVVVILPGDAMERIEFSITSKPKDSKPGTLTKIIQELSSVFITRIRRIVLPHQDSES